MTSRNRVVWSEGLFLRPHHFQQLDRFIDRQIDLRATAVRSHGWGFSELEINRDLLAVGKLRLERIRGVFPDGTPFSAPDDDPLPPALDVDRATRDAGIVLAIPIQKSGVPAFHRGAGIGSDARFSIAEIEVRDATPDSQEMATLEVAGLRTQLHLESDVGNDRSIIPLARVIQVQTSGFIQLDDSFMPTVLSVRTAPALATFLAELLGMIKQGADHLASVAVTKGQTSDLREFLLLQVMNRWEPVLIHVQNERDVHPEFLYRICIQLLGDLAALTLDARRPGAMPIYQHVDLRATFAPLMSRIRAALGAPIDHRTVSIPLEIKKNGYRLGIVGDKRRFDDSDFVLAVSGEQPDPVLTRSVVGQVTIAAAERTRDLVNNAIPGITLTLTQAPREIPIHRGFLYFKLDVHHPEWASLKNSPNGIGIHVPDAIPGAQLELWAIRR